MVSFDPDITNAVDPIPYATRDAESLQTTVNKILEALSSPNAARAMLPPYEDTRVTIPALDGENIGEVVAATRKAAISGGIGKVPEE
jgi:hypothetical protein